MTEKTAIFNDTTEEKHELGGPLRHPYHFNILILHLGF